MTSRLTDELRRHALEADVKEEKDPMNLQKFVVWKPTSDGRMMRISMPLNAVSTIDGDVQWTAGFIREYEKIQKSLWQKLMGLNIEGAIIGPDGHQYKDVGENADATLIWSRKIDQSVDPMLETRVIRSKVKTINLAKSLMAIKGMLPVKRTINLDDDYPAPENTFLPTADVRLNFKSGIDYILGQVYDSPRDGEHVSTPLLRGLKEFRKDHVRWAEIREDRNIFALEPGDAEGAWLTVIPSDSSLMNDKIPSCISVRAEKGLKDKPVWLMRVLPVGFTKEWAGIAGVHELEHLENLFSGKEPAKASRSEYVDGEIRAFTAEMGAADILSRGRFLKAIDSMIEVYQWTDFEQIKPILRTHPALILMARNLDPYITTQQPLSQHEGGIRLAFYWMATALRMAERTAAGNPELAHLNKIKVLEFAYGSDEVDMLPKH